MNLHGIASTAISGVNPFILAQIKHSSGTYVTGADGKRTPNYVSGNVMVQMQPITTGDVKHLAALNIQGVHAAIYVNGNYNAVVRSQGFGGDIVTIGVLTYLVVAVLESWPDWSKLALTLQ